MDPLIKVRHKLLVLLMTAVIVSGGISRCDKTPKGQTVDKTVDHMFSITINGFPTLYRPNQNYTITIQGLDENQVLKFQDFMLVAEPAEGSTITDPNGLGTFELFPDEAMIQFSQKCSHAVKATSFISKEIAKVYWIAPTRGSGCIDFKAMVMERLDLWYMDDDKLIYRLCEDQSTRSFAQDIMPCCACDEAKYEVIFEGLWSRHNHPKDFPEDEWRTQFSTLIGASHSKNYSLWDYGGLASPALRALGERETTRPIETQMKQFSQSIRSVIKAQGLKQRSNVEEKTFAVFRVDPSHHLLSIVSKMIPSPDFIVGISKENLCMNDCSWIPHRVIDLYPWDIGTDQSLAYQSSKIPEVPQKPIKRITSTDPDDPKSPFFDTLGSPINPVARLHIIRQRIYNTYNCFKDQTEGAFGPIINPGWREEFRRDDQNPGYDIVSDSYIYHGEGIGSHPTNTARTLESDYGRQPSDPCEVSEYSEWSPCSRTCRPASRFRKREYLRENEASDANCNLKLTHKMTCDNLPKCEPRQYGGNFNLFESDNQVKSWNQIHGKKRKYDDDVSSSYPTNYPGQNSYTYEGIQTSYIYPKPSRLQGDEILSEESEINCDVTLWGQWSHCSSSCGKGIQTRSRRYREWDKSQSCSEDLHDNRSCVGRSPACPNYRQRRPDRQSESGVCDVSPWSTWSPCSKKCSNGYKMRTRLYTEPFVPNRSCDVQLIDKEDCYGTECDSSMEESYLVDANDMKSQNLYDIDYIARNQDNSDVGIVRTEEVDICQMEPDPGPCIGHYIRWFYNGLDNTCKTFVFRGCEGNKNSFASQSECLETCRTRRNKDWKNSHMKPDPFHELQALSFIKLPNDEPFKRPKKKPSVDCEVSRWTSWSPCSKLCGQQGWQTRRRETFVQPAFGGRSCPRNFIRRRKCKGPLCNPTDHNQWYQGSWRNILGI